MTFIVPRIANIFVEYNQQDASLHDLNCVASIPLCTLIKFYYPSRLSTTYSNSCKLLKLVNYATYFGLSMIITIYLFL